MKKNICIIGLGYVGLPLAFEFSKYHNVLGYDSNIKRINELKKKKDTNKQVSKKFFYNGLKFI